ncbi:DUF3999 family protein [Sphingomonas sp. RT2P30]|uniref:DUF3999 family protein n=1 Tax=Parasphingomonas halimpatiens TaxID=3096162 RepID=UPI002FCAA7BC
MRRGLIVLAAVFALTGAARAAGDDAPTRYPVQLRVTPVAGAPVQRLALPLSILAGSRSSDLADVRLFDSAGGAVPIARAPAPAMTARRETRLPALPIIGAADTPRVTGVSVRLDARGQPRLVSLAAGGGEGRTATLAVLFDARHLGEPSDTLILDADWPASRPVTFVVEASGDLQHWRTIGQRVAFRSADGMAEKPEITLHDAAPGWIRVSWDTASTVTVRSGLFAATTTRDPAPLMLEAMPPPPTDTHEIAFAVPFATPVAALQIVPAGIGTLLPVRIFGRDSAEQAWQPIGAGTVFRLAAKDGERVGEPIALDDAHFRYWRIAADGKGPGFVASPRLRFAFAPAEIVFVASGPAPLLLVAGRAAQPDTYLSLDSVLAGSGSREVSSLPVAATAPSAAPATLQLITGDGDSDAVRRIALWALLLAATAALGFMAWRLARRPAAT